MLYSFSSCNPQVKTKLLLSFCLSLYGSALWFSSSSALRSLEIAFNNILRRIWSLPRMCHICTVSPSWRVLIISYLEDQLSWCRQLSSLNHRYSLMSSRHHSTYPSPVPATMPCMAIVIKRSTQTKNTFVVHSFETSSWHPRWILILFICDLHVYFLNLTL